MLLKKCELRQMFSAFEDENHIGAFSERLLVIVFCNMYHDREKDEKRTQPHRDRFVTASLGNRGSQAFAFLLFFNRLRRDTSG